MPYYELKTDKVTKFWEIHHFPEPDKYFLLRYGKIGSAGSMKRVLYTQASFPERYTKRETERKLGEGYKLVKDSNPSELKKLYSVYQVTLRQKLLAKTAKKPVEEKKTQKECPPGKVLNPKTNRCNKVKILKKTVKKPVTSPSKPTEVVAKPVATDKDVVWDVKKQGVMLAHTFKDTSTGKVTSPPKGTSPAPIGWYLSEKYDGYRAIWDGQDFRSRVGNIFNAPEEFKAWMPKGIALDGELFAGRENFEKCGIFRKKEPCWAEWKKMGISYQVFDIPSHSGPFEERMKVLQELVKKLCSVNKSQCPIKLTRQTKVKSEEDLTETFKELLSKGAEGVMLRAPNSPYEPKRSRYLLKVKQFFDAECKIVGYTPGTGKYKDKLGAFICELENGKRFQMSGMTDSVRENYMTTHPVGTIVTYTYMGLTGDGIPRHPGYLRKRESRE